MMADGRPDTPGLILIAGMILFVVGGGICAELQRLSVIPALVGLAGLALCGWALWSNQL